MSFFFALLLLISCSRSSFKRVDKLHKEQAVFASDTKSKVEYMIGINRLIRELAEEKRLGGEFSFSLKTDRSSESLMLGVAPFVILSFRNNMPFDDFWVYFSDLKDFNYKINEKNGRVVAVVKKDNEKLIKKLEFDRALFGSEQEREVELFDYVEYDKENERIKIKGKDSIFIDLMKYMVNPRDKASLGGNFIDVNKCYVDLRLLEIIVTKCSTRVLEEFLKKTHKYVDFYESTYNALIITIAKGEEVERLKLLLKYMKKKEEEKNRNIIESFSKFPEELAFALANDNTNMARILVENGFSFEGKTKKGLNPSDGCGYRGHQNAIEFCLAEGAVYRTGRSVFKKKAKILAIGAALGVIGVSSEAVGDSLGIVALSILGNALVSKIVQFFNLTLDLKAIEIVRNNFAFYKGRGEWVSRINFKGKKIKIAKRIVVDLKSVISEFGKTLKSIIKKGEKEKEREREGEEDSFQQEIRLRDDLLKLNEDISMFQKTLKEESRQKGKNRLLTRELVKEGQRFKDRYEILFEKYKKVLLKQKEKLEDREREAREGDGEDRGDRGTAIGSTFFDCNSELMLFQANDVGYKDFVRMFEQRRGWGMRAPTKEDLSILFPFGYEGTFWTGSVDEYGRPGIFNLKTKETYLPLHTSLKYSLLAVKDLEGIYDNIQ